MAKAKDDSQYVDLFGNTTLTPQQVVMQQISRAIRQSQDAFAGASVPVRAAATIGSGIGAAFRSALMHKGILEKDPELEEAEKTAVVREKTAKDAKESGVDILKDPGGYTSIAVKHFLNAGMETAAFRAMQMGQMFEARKRAAELEAGKLEKTKAEADKAAAEADKIRAETPSIKAISAAKLDLLQNQAHLAKVKAAGLQVLTSLKQNDPNRVKVQKFNSIISEIEKAKGKITPTQRKVLDEYAKVDPLNRMLGQTLGGAGGPAEVPGGMNDKPEEEEHYDFSATP